jgi:hypothetical protein
MFEHKITGDHELLSLVPFSEWIDLAAEDTSEENIKRIVRIFQWLHETFSHLVFRYSLLSNLLTSCITYGVVTRAFATDVAQRIDEGAGVTVVGGRSTVGGLLGVGGDERASQGQISCISRTIWSFRTSQIQLFALQLKTVLIVLIRKDLQESRR